MTIRNFKDYHKDEQKDLLSHTDRKDLAEAVNDFREPTHNLAKVGINRLFDRLVEKILEPAD